MRNALALALDIGVIVATACHLAGVLSIVAFVGWLMAAATGFFLLIVTEPMT